MATMVPWQEDGPSAPLSSWQPEGPLAEKWPGPLSCLSGLMLAPPPLPRTLPASCPLPRLTPYPTWVPTPPGSL